MVGTYQYESFPILDSSQFVKSRLIGCFIEEDSNSVTCKKDDEVRVQT